MEDFWIGYQYAKLSEISLLEAGIMVGDALARYRQDHGPPGEIRISDKWRSVWGDEPNYDGVAIIYGQQRRDEVYIRGTNRHDQPASISGTRQTQPRGKRPQGGQPGEAVVPGDNPGRH